MNVLHIIDTSGPGGAETIFTELAAHTAEVGSGLTIATVRGKGWVQQRLDSYGVRTLVIDCKGSFNLRFLRALCSTIKEHRIDVVHAHLLGSNVYASLAGLLTGARVVSTFHGSVDIGAQERFWGLKAFLIRAGSQMVAVSEELSLALSEKMSVSRDAINVIPNAIDCERFAQERTLDRNDQFRPERSLPIIGALGNIRPAKAYAVAIEAVAKLRSQGIEVALYIAGHEKEPLISELLAIRNRLNLEKQVFFLGFVDDPAKFLASIDIFLLSSSSEGHPLALTQAMAAGLPIVSTRCGVERIIDETMAWLVNVGDSNSLAAALEEVIAKPAEAESRGRAARREAFDKYDFASMFARYDALYRSLVAS